MDYVQLTLDDYIQCKTEIKENLTGIVKSFVKIGWQLTRIDASRAYTMDGYNSIAEFAQGEYGMSRSGTSRFMSVYERYSIPGDTPELQERYKDFEFSQLSEMLQLTEEDQNMITSDTKRADIRELKKFNKENEHNPEQLLNWKKEEENRIYTTIFEFFKSSKETLNGLFGSEAYRTGSLEQMVDIVNPSGSRSFRKERVFLMMHGPEKGISVKQIMRGTETMSWGEFFNITQDLFGEKASGSRTWEAYFGENEKTEEPIQSASISKDTVPNTKIAPAQQPTEKEESQKMTSPETSPEVEEAAEKVEEQATETVEKPVDNSGKELLQEEQIPGQDSILNHEEYMPKPIPSASPEASQPEEPQEAVESETGEEPEDTEIEKPEEHEVVEKSIRRKEFMDSLTEYGAADYLAKSFRSFGNVTFSQLQNTNFWLRWMDEKVDHLGIPWVE